MSEEENCNESEVWIEALILKLKREVKRMSEEENCNESEVWIEALILKLKREVKRMSEEENCNESEDCQDSCEEQGEFCGMNFGLAIEAMKKGKKVARQGWNGKNMFLIYVDGTENCPLRENTPYYNALNSPENGQSHVSINPHIDMFTATGEFQPGWLASQTDMLADDWQIVD